ncbi:MAG: hypothetical protein F4181_10075, partial [Proteobacteria bacterium]|nr:hypothetical protein [Pseudomonadota bacterium]
MANQELIASYALDPAIVVIHEYRKRETRQIIGFFDEDPPEEAVTCLGAYDVRRFDESDIVEPRRMASIAAVVFRQQSTVPIKVKRDLEKFAESLLWRDCRVFVELLPIEPGSKTPDFDSLVYQVMEERRLPVSGLKPEKLTTYTASAEEIRDMTPMVHVFRLPDTWSDVAAYLRDFPPGESPSNELSVTVRGRDDSIIVPSPEEKILLERAFHDCHRVKLIENSGGLSGVRTYKAFADNRYEYVGNRTRYEYFAKIGDRDLISKEYLSYRDIALEHIPFHLGPRLRLDRCVLGTQLGIIVSDYVSGAE